MEWLPAVLLTLSFSIFTRPPPIDTLLADVVERGLGLPINFGRFKRDVVELPLAATDWEKNGQEC